jgi:hypothetical protein
VPQRTSRPLFGFGMSIAHARTRAKVVGEKYDEADGSKDWGRAVKLLGCISVYIVAKDIAKENKYKEKPVD